MQRLRLAKLSVSALACLSLSAAALAQPANDFCGSAQAITLTDPFVRIVGNNFSATADLPSGSGCAANDLRDVWYTFVAPRAGVYGVTTLAGSANGIDTALSAYSTCNPLSAATRIACNDDLDNSASFFNPDSYIRFTLAAGQPVWIRVAGDNSGQGAFALTIAAPALNDRCANALPAQLDTPITATNISSTTSFTVLNAGSACAGGDNASRGAFDVFYTFTPPVTGPYRLSLCGSEYDTNLTVFAGCPAGADPASGTPPQVAAATVIACSEDATTGSCAGTLASEISTVNLSAGVPYLVRVAGYDYSGFSIFGPNIGQGVFTLTISSASPPPPAPANDLCANGSVLTSLPFDTGDVQIGGATDDADITCNAFGTTSTRSGIWYTYTPATSCTLLARPIGSTISSIAIFTGDCGSLNQVDCSGNGFLNENMTFAAQAGTTYRILVGRYEASAAGPFDTTRVTFDCITPIANDTCQTAQTLAYNSPVNGDNTNATNQNDGPSNGCQPLAGKGLWYRFTAGSNDPVTITTCGSAIDTVLHVFNSVDCSNPGIGALYACADGGCPDPNPAGNARLENLPVTSGETYYIRVTSGRGVRTTPPGGAFVITLEGVAPTTVVCCRGTTCTLVSPAECTVPASPIVGVLQAGTGACNASGSNTSPCCFADFDKSGLATIDDIFIYLNAWFASSPYTRVGGNGTGTPTLDDLFIFLNVWFGGCA